jgi:hypothetical protein
MWLIPDATYDPTKTIFAKSLNRSHATKGCANDHDVAINVNSVTHRHSQEK